VLRTFERVLQKAAPAFAVTRSLLAAAPRLERGRSPITEVNPAQDVVLASMVTRIGSIPKTTFAASRSCIGAR
jgi:hypothetical protein